MPYVGTISTDVDFKAANPPVWVGSGRQTGTVVSGPNWQTEAQGLMSAQFVVSAVLYKHEYKTIYRCLSGCPHPIMQAGPTFEEPNSGGTGIFIKRGDQNQPAATIQSDTPMFAIEITVNGGTEIKASKTFYWSDFVCKDPIPFAAGHNANNFDGAFPLGPIRMDETKRTPCYLNAGTSYTWAGLNDSMRAIELTTSIAAGTRGLEYRVVNKYPFYDFYVLFGQVNVTGFKG